MRDFPVGKPKITMKRSYGRMKEHKSVSVMIELPSIKKLLLRFKNIAPSIHQCRSNDYYKLLNESREYIT